MQSFKLESSSDVSVRKGGNSIRKTEHANEKKKKSFNWNAWNPK